MDTSCNKVLDTSCNYLMDTSCNSMKANYCVKCLHLTYFNVGL